MNDLTSLPQNALPAMTTTLALSQGLRLLLECERSADDAMNGIVNNPALHAELKAALPAIMDRVKGGGISAVRDVIGRRLVTFPQPDRSDAEWAAWWADYFDALEDVPGAALEAGMKAWVQKPDAQFMPKPGELRALALKAGEPLYQAASRARRVAHLPLRTFGPLDAEQAVSAEERKAIAAEILASLKPKAAPGVKPAPDQQALSLRNGAEGDCEVTHKPATSTACGLMRQRMERDWGV